MKPTSFALTFISLICLVLNACDAPPPPPETGPEYSAEVKEVIDAKNALIIEAYRSGDIAAAAEHFADNCVQMPPNSAPMRGVEEYKAAWEQNAAFGTWDFQLQAREVRATGDLAVELGTYTLNFSPNETSPIPPLEDEGNYVVAWQKIDGDWKILWDAPVSTVPLPMPEEAEAE